MDPERLPLLAPTASQLKSRRFRPLNYDEVIISQLNMPWNRARFCLMLFFWAIMAVFLSIVASILMKENCSKSIGPSPSVPPVHMTFAPLVT